MVAFTFPSPLASAFLYLQRNKGPGIVFFFSYLSAHNINNNSNNNSNKSPIEMLHVRFQPHEPKKNASEKFLMRITMGIFVLTRPLAHRWRHDPPPHPTPPQ